MRSFITLFRCSTGEDWQAVMSDLWADDNSNSSVLIIVLFFWAFIILMTFVMLNLFMLVLVQQFEANFSNPDNPLDSFTHNTEDFREEWSQHTAKYMGLKIKTTKLNHFFMGIRKPLGFKGMTKRDIHWSYEHEPVAIIDVAKAIYQMNIAEDR